MFLPYTTGAEEAEQLALQRMHALEASGMQDSHELLRLRKQLRAARNLTQAEILKSQLAVM